MLIRIGYEFVFSAPTATSMLLMLSTHASRAGTLRRPDWMHAEPVLHRDDFQDAAGNRCTRIAVPAGGVRLWNDTLVEDSGQPDPLQPNAAQHALHDLPAEALPYLLGSRYCEVDRLSDTAWELFGWTAPGWGRVQAVCDWVHSHVRFDHAWARPTKSACDVYLERAGVCRDFAHLAVAFCRCLMIPARYATGYLGDIGVPSSDAPMDFSAWFEVFLGGEWRTFDARHNVPRVGRVLMARGRDAADVAMTTSFGVNRLEKFAVWAHEISAGFQGPPGG